MKYVIASFAAAAALFVTTGAASAQPGGGHHSGGHHNRSHGGHYGHSRYFGPHSPGAYNAPRYAYGAGACASRGYYVPNVGVYSFPAPVYPRGYSPGCGY